MQQYNFSSAIKDTLFLVRLDLQLHGVPVSVISMDTDYCTKWSNIASAEKIDLLYNYI